MTEPAPVTDPAVTDPAVTDPGRVDLVRSACRRLCRWRPAGETRGGLPLFRCAGCRSEWVRTEGWAPVDADGTRDAALEAEVAARRAGPPPDPTTSGPGAGGAGSAGRCGSTGS